MKVVINTCFGGFGLSPEASEILAKAKRTDIDCRPGDRSDPWLVRVVQRLGSRANGACAELKVVEIPDGIEWEICEYDGSEWIAEKHRTWR